MAGGRALSRILKDDDGMPSSAGLWKWAKDFNEVAEKLAQARELGIEHILGEVVDIADNDNADVRIVHDQHGNPEAKIDGEAIQRSKLRVETRLKYAAMIAPKKYGDKLDVTSKGQALAPANSVTIDARVQSIVMTARRRREAAEMLD